MKAILLTTLILYLLSPMVHGQKQGNIWYFGDAAGIDFNTDPPSPLLDGQTDFTEPLGWNEGCTSISDSSGVLLFYSNGQKAWNANQEVMLNGDDLFGNSSSSSSSLIVPMPGSDQFFYLFTTDAVENNFENGLRYSIVDMCLDDEKGGVLDLEKNIELYSNAAEKLCAVPHTNDSDYWIITHELYNDRFVSLLLTEEGITDTIFSETGSSEFLGWGGQLVVSPNIEKLAYTMPCATLDCKTLLLDFDASTGVISNEQILNQGGIEWGVSFSENSERLYLGNANSGEVYQHDLSAGNLSEIIDSKLLLSSAVSNGVRHFQLGPDGKIYISISQQSTLARIEFPNTLGIDCNYDADAYDLGGATSSFGLPNFITGYAYTNTARPCEDNTGISNNKSTLDINLYPTPAKDVLNISFSSLEMRIAELIIYNSEGKIVSHQNDFEGSNLSIPISDFPRGIYFLKIKINGKDWVSRNFAVE